MKKRNEPDLQDILNGATEDLSYSLNCHRIGIIESFNAAEQTATVRMVDKGIIQYDDGEQLVSLSLLVDCPVVIYKGSKGGLTIPINAGDSCLVCFNDRDLDSWLVDGLVQRPNTLRNHDLSDAIVVVGVRNQINKITDYNNEATELNYLGNKLSIDGDAINLLHSAGNNISIDNAKINLINASGGSIVLDSKLELKNAAENLKAVIDDFITIITSLKTVDNPASPTITLVVDTPTTDALTALSIRVGALLK